MENCEMVKDISKKIQSLSIKVDELSKSVIYLMNKKPVGEDPKEKEEEYISKKDIVEKMPAAYGIGPERIAKLLISVGHPYHKRDKNKLKFKRQGLEGRLECIWKNMTVNNIYSRLSNNSWIFRFKGVDIVHCKKESRNLFAEKIIEDSPIEGHLKHFLGLSGSDSPPVSEPHQEDEQA